MPLHRLFILHTPQHVQSLYVFLDKNWQAFADQGRALSITVSEHKAKRSVDQNKRLHALLSDIASTAWVNGRQYDQETWKEMFRQKFIGSEEIELPNGKRIERGISTTTLSVSEFADFMTKIEEYAVSELSVELSI